MQHINAKKNKNSGQNNEVRNVTGSPNKREPLCDKTNRINTKCKVLNGTVNSAKKCGVSIEESTMVKKGTRSTNRNIDDTTKVDKENKSNQHHTSNSRKPLQNSKTNTESQGTKNEVPQKQGNKNKSTNVRKTANESVLKNNEQESTKKQLKNKTNKKSDQIGKNLGGRQGKLSKDDSNTDQNCVANQHQERPNEQEKEGSSNIQKLPRSRSRKRTISVKNNSQHETNHQKQEDDEQNNSTRGRTRSARKLESPQKKITVEKLGKPTKKIEESQVQQLLDEKANTKSSKVSTKEQKSKRNRSGKRLEDLESNVEKLKEQQQSTTSRRTRSTGKVADAYEDKEAVTKQTQERTTKNVTRNQTSNKKPMLKTNKVPLNCDDKEPCKRTRSGSRKQDDTTKNDKDLVNVESSNSTDATESTEEANQVALKSDNKSNRILKNPIIKHTILATNEIDTLPKTTNPGVSLFLNNFFNNEKGQKKQVGLLKANKPTVKQQHKELVKPALKALQEPIKSVLKQAPIKMFRSRNHVNYAELTLNESTNVPSKTNTEDGKLPIYKQAIINEEYHNHDDEYEFDSDSEKPVLKRKRKKQGDDEKQVVKKTKKKKQDLNDSSLYDKKMMNVLSKIAGRIRKRQQPNDEANKVMFTVASVEKGGELDLAVNNVQRPDNFDAQDRASPISDHGNDVVMENYAEHEVAPDLIEDISRGFGFDENSLSPIQNRQSNIIVHENVRITNSRPQYVDSPQNFCKRRPTANSTMLGDTQSPWRYDYFVKRRPYIVRIKPSGLPAIEQEPVIDHTFDTTPTEKSKDFEGLKKEPVQASILDYIPGHEHIKQNDKPQELSLFDMNQFSPVKRKAANAIGSPRKVLGERNDIINAVSTPIRVGENTIISPNLSNIMQENDKENENSFFGFANETTIVEEPQQPKPLPSRFSLNTFKKYQKKPKLIREKSPIHEKPAEDEPEFVEQADSSIDSCDESFDVKLFDDIEEPEQDTSLKPAKSRKRTKMMTADDSDEFSTKRRKREKENPEFIKWAADMTAHFNEIENFDLEVE